MPVVVLLWLAGWVLYWRGSGSWSREERAERGSDGVEVRAAVFEEFEESED